MNLKTKNPWNTNELKLICRTTLKRIDLIEEKLYTHPFTNSIRRLLNEYSRDNHDTTQFLLDPRRVWEDGWMRYGDNKTK